MSILVDKNTKVIVQGLAIRAVDDLADAAQKIVAVVG